MTHVRFPLPVTVRRGVGVLVTGLIAGVGVVVFRWTLRALVDLLQHAIGVKRLVAVTEISRLTGGRLWLLPVFILIGFLLAKVVSVKSGVARRGERGADRVIEVVNGSTVKLPMPEALGTGVAGVIALGTGVSGGPEGPIAMLVGGPLINWLPRLGLEKRDVRMFVACGVGAALACLFQAPLAGVLLAGELFVVGGFLGVVILPGLLITAIAWGVDTAVYGGSPLIGHLSFGTIHPEAYATALVAGVMAGAIGLLYRWWIVVAGKEIIRCSRSAWWRWAVIALAVTVITSGIALVAPEVLSTGTGWIRLVTLGAVLRSWPLWLLLLVPVARLVLTGLSLSAEAPIGVLGPALIIGTFSGAALWRLAALAHVPVSFGSLATVALLMFAAVFGSIGRVPLSMIVIALEATGSMTIAPLLVVAVGVATVIVHRRGMTIFGAQATPGQSPLAPLG